MKSNGNHEKNGSPLDRSPFLEKHPTSPPLTHVSFLKPSVREKQESRWVGRDPATVNNSTSSRFCLFVSRLSHYSDPLIVFGIIPLLSALEMAMAKNADKIGLR